MKKIIAGTVLAGSAMLGLVGCSGFLDYDYGNAGKVADAAKVDQITDAVNSIPAAIDPADEVVASDPFFIGTMNHYLTFRTACEHEDQRGCVWNADTSGNDTGMSFWTDMNGEGFVYSNDDAQKILDEGANALVTPLATINN